MNEIFIRQSPPQVLNRVSSVTCTRQCDLHQARNCLNIKTLNTYFVNSSDKSCVASLNRTQIATTCWCYLAVINCHLYWASLKLMYKILYNLISYEHWMQTGLSIQYGTIFSLICTTDPVSEIPGNLKIEIPTQTILLYMST